MNGCNVMHKACVKAQLPSGFFAAEMQSLLRGLPVRRALVLSLQQPNTTQCKPAFKPLSAHRCERLAPQASSTALQNPVLQRKVKSAGCLHVNGHCRRSHARQHKLGDACVTRVAEASRDEEATEVATTSPKDDGPSAAYIIGSLAAVMGLGIANRCALKGIPR